MDTVLHGKAGIVDDLKGRKFLEIIVTIDFGSYFVRNYGFSSSLTVQKPLKNNSVKVQIKNRTKIIIVTS